ncbi:MAG: LysR family transcriptional regulator [Pseudomonadota bacterium]
MNLRQLRSLLAIADHGSFTAAGDAIGLSHSAISLHIKALEEFLGATLIDRSLRPPRLTERGVAIAAHARQMEGLVEEMRALASDQGLAGALTVGVVPTAMVHLMPPALAALRQAHPRLVTRLRTGPSGDLAEAVRAGDLDAALVTSPHPLPEGLTIREVAAERLLLIAPPGTPDTTAEALIATNPFIWFSRKTWAGREIERLLSHRGLRPREAMEADALEAIEALVRHGLGVSVVPERAGAPPPPDVRAMPLDWPGAVRRLALIGRQASPKAPLTHALHAELAGIAAQREGHATSRAG